MANEQELAVRTETMADPLVARIFTILRDRIEQRCSARVVEARTGAQIILAVDGGLPHDAFCIDPVGTAVRVAGGSPRGLLYGVGKFLRTSGYEGAFHPSAWRGTSEPRGSVRGMYFAAHFHNWYQAAPETEIIRYTEDLALWGVNAIMICFPFINLLDWNDSEAEAAVSMAGRYARCAHELGLLFGSVASNTLFRDIPEHLRAARLPDPTGRRGNSGYPVCPSRAEGHTFLLENYRRMFEHLSNTGLDFLVHWPYDAGGCACEACLPWGSNGFLKLSHDLTRVAREYFPHIKTILSTWMFDTPLEGEWQGLTDALRANPGGIDYILADAHENFPRYPLDVGVPGNLPLLNFPEISMWGNWPWGGVGANPLPARFQRLWDQVKHAVQGGFPYSEGIYEDINKAVVVQFYWDADRSARTTLKEYIAYEFGPAVTRDVLAVVDLLEMAAGRSYTKRPVDVEGAERAARLAEDINRRLPDWARRSWRWEVLHLRALLDLERFGDGGLTTPAAESAMTRLMEIYHSEMETDDPYHHRVRPPLRRAISRCEDTILKTCKQ